MTSEERPERPPQVYAAFLKLVELVESLVRRPGRDKSELPLLCLVSEPGGGSPLAMVAHVFAGGDRRAPHGHVRTAGRDVRALLHEAYVALSTGNFGMDPLRFRHYALAEWLMTVDLSELPTSRWQAELARELRRNIGLRAHRDAPATAQALGGWPGLTLWLAAVVLPATMLRVLTTGSLFGIGRQFRWFMRQQYLAPRLASNFLSFAVRLTIRARDNEDQEQIDLLLVHAFLQDLRVQYRRRPWRLAAWRRTANPVLLLEGIAPTNGGYALLRLINAVRNETGQSDPLLVITHSHDVPPEGLAPADPAATGQLVPLDGVGGTFRAWREDLPAARRARRDDAWYLPVEIPPANLTPFRQRLPRIAPARPPLLSRRLVLAGLVGCLVAGVGGWQVPGIIAAREAGCLQSPLRSDGLVSTVVRGNECVGYSDSARQMFSKDTTLIAVQELIFRQNREAEAAWRIRNDHPLVTLIYLGSLTRPDALSGEETFAGEREELQGMAAAQARAFQQTSESRANPYLRIVIANAGQEMRHSAEVVRMLAKLARDDATVLGVVGLVESRDTIGEAITQLGAAGLPVIAPVLSADGIGDGSGRYLQISAPNKDEAQLVHNHTNQVLRKTKIFNYYTYGAGGRPDGESNDLYVDTLRDRLREKFGDNYRELYWTPDRDLRAQCADEFSDGVVFFGGRYGDFGAFASKLASDCSGNLPHLIGDDSVTRYMANASLRQSAPENLPVAYVAKGALAYCDQLKETADAKPVGDTGQRAGDTERRFFYSDVQTVLSLCTSDSPIGERVGLAYDATRMLLKAVTHLASGAQSLAGDTLSDQITPTRVYSTIRDGANPYYGVTGLVRFDTNGVAVGKRLTLLCATNIKEAFRGAGNVPKEIDRFPGNEEEDHAYRSPQLNREPCT